MTEFGYWLSSEEHGPSNLVRDARRAEELGFSFAMISDHFHPWTGPRTSSRRSRPSSTSGSTPAVATEHVPCGPDPEPVVEAVREWEQAGFDRVSLHQAGPDQDGFFRFWERELQPRLGS